MRPRAPRQRRRQRQRSAPRRLPLACLPLADAWSDGSRYGSSDATRTSGGHPVERGEERGNAIVIKEQNRQQRHRVSESFNKTTTPWELLKMAEKGGSPGNGDAGLVSSSCLSSGAGMLGLSRIQQNPFAIKTTTPTRSVADSTENKESKPIVAPPTLVLGADNACAVSSSGSRIVLRPSALAFQAEKLKQTSDVASTETKDNSAAASVPGEQQQQQMPSASRDLREVSSTCESTTGPVTNGTRTSSAGSGAEDDNSGSTTTSSSNGRAIGEGQRQLWPGPG
ncbi:hypothetical protein MRX96_020602 [Rhipicephalus microplus]